MSLLALIPVVLHELVVGTDRQELAALTSSTSQETDNGA